MALTAAMPAAFASAVGVPAALPVGAARSLPPRLASRSAATAAAVARRSRGVRDSRRCRMVMTGGEGGGRPAAAPAAAERAVDAAAGEGGAPRPERGAPRVGRRQVLATGLAAAVGMGLTGSTPPSGAIAAATPTSYVAALSAAESATAASAPYPLALFSVNASSSAPYHATLERRVRVGDGGEGDGWSDVRLMSLMRDVSWRYLWPRSGESDDSWQNGPTNVVYLDVSTAVSTFEPLFSPPLVGRFGHGGVGFFFCHISWGDPLVGGGPLGTSARH